MTATEARRMWDLAHHFWPIGSSFRYFARRPDTGTGAAIFGGSIAAPAELARATDWADREGYNSYWQPNPTRKKHGVRCSTRDITHLVYFMVDIDPVEIGANPRPCLEMAGTILRTELPPYFTDAVVIDSGRGIQALYPTTPVELTSTFDVGEPRQIRTLRDIAPVAFRFWLEEIRNRLGPEGVYAGCTVDTACSDLPRVMRMPYTINQKTGARAELVHACNQAPMGLVPALINRAPAALWTQVERPTPLGPRTSWGDFIPHMTVTGRRFVTEGSSPPGRHKGATAAMLSLLELGASEQQIRQALYFGSALCEPVLSYREVDAMVNRRFSQTAVAQRLTSTLKSLDTQLEAC